MHSQKQMVSKMMPLAEYESKIWNTYIPPWEKNRECIRLWGSFGVTKLESYVILFTVIMRMIKRIHLMSTGTHTEFFY